jgi:hypothetical protein
MMPQGPVRAAGAGLCGRRGRGRRGGLAQGLRAIVPRSFKTTVMRG